MKGDNKNESTSCNSGDGSCDTRRNRYSEEE